VCDQDPLVNAMDDLLAKIGDDRELDEVIATVAEELAAAGASKDRIVAEVAKHLTVEDKQAAAKHIVDELIECLLGFCGA